jgi:hypothetical protein
MAFIWIKQGYTIPKTICKLVLEGRGFHFIQFHPCITVKYYGLSNCVLEILFHL